MILKIKKFLLTNSSVRQTIIKNTFWLSVSATLSKVIRSVFVIYAARLIGSGEFGVFSYALGIVSIFSLFSDIGLTPLLTRELARSDEVKRERNVRSIINLKAILLILSFALVILVSPFVSKIPEANSILPLVALLVFLDNIRSFGFSVIRADNKMEKESKIEIVTEIITAIAGITIIYFNPTVNGLVTGYLIGSATGVFLIITAMRKLLKNLFSNFDKNGILEMFKMASPYALVGIFGMFMTNIDTYIIGFFLNASYVGLYAAALRPVGIIYLVPTFLSGAIFPIMNRFHIEKNETGLNRVLENGIIATLAIAIPITIGGIIMGGSLMYNLFGDGYKGSIEAFKILLITTLPIFPGVIMGFFLISKGIRKAPVKATALGALVNVVLDILLIPKYGIEGSAITTLFAQLIMNFILFIEVKKVTKIKVFRKTPKILISGILMGLIVYLLINAGINSLIVMFIGAAVYITLLFILKENTLLQVLGEIKTK